MTSLHRDQTAGAMLESLAMDPDLALTIADLMAVMADPLRIRIFSALVNDPRGEACAGDIAELAQLSQPTVSHHLKVLKTQHFLLSEKRGTQVWYRLAPDRADFITSVLEVFLSAEKPQSNISDDVSRDLDSALNTIIHALSQEKIAKDDALIASIVRESFTGLVRSSKRGRELIRLTELFARQRLHDMDLDTPQHHTQVLFVCVGNSGRSQLAAALMTELSGGTVIARSAGSQPAEDIHPLVRDILETMPSTDTSLIFPKPLTDDALRAADVVVTMGCGDVCPILPGIHYEDWSVGDPALATASGVEAIRVHIETKVRELLTTLNTTGKPPR